MSTLLIRRADLGTGVEADVMIRGGTIAEIGHDLNRAGVEVIDARGGALVPGLTDHHLHLHAMAAQAASICCGPPSVHSESDLGVALGRADSDADGWLRGVGYIETVAGELDSRGLDRVHGARPVRIQHRSGAMWMLNSRAAEAVGLSSADHPGIDRSSDGTPTGRLWRADDWLRERLPDNGPPDLTDVGRLLLGYGITAVTDATPDLAPSSQRAILDAVDTGALPQRVHLLGSPRDGPTSERVTVGPYKIVLADSDPPDLDELAHLIDQLHRVGRPFAAHCVSRENFVILLAALDQVGALTGDRVEHGALIPADSIAEVRRHGLTVVTQPGFLADRGDDYLRDVDPRDVGDLYRCRSLVDAAVPLALSSDAPYGPLDPWADMRSAMYRSTASGAVVGPGETLSAEQAFERYLTPVHHPGGPARTVRVGGPADLVLLHTPLIEMLRNPSADAVRLTLP
jgi:predicted amidohydrolase YtcJ